MTINEANKNRIKFHEIKNLAEDDKFDTKAILIKNINNKKLGYIPEKDNIIFSRGADGKWVR